MIRAISASKDAFHPVTFEPGLNLILADVTPTSSEKDSRNGVGKTSLVEIVHFCFGSTLHKADTLKDGALADWAFTLRFDLGDRVVEVTRAIARSGHVTLDAGDGPKELPISQWTELLGREFFDLPPRGDGDGVAPSFRSLISFVARRERYAYDHPFEHHHRQPTWDRQVNMTYLLGLGWRDASTFEALRRRKKWLDAERAVSKSRELAATTGTPSARPRQRGRLDADRVRLEEAVRALDEQLRAFRVHPEYAKIEEEANALTRQLQRVANENLADRNLLTYYEEAAAGEQAPGQSETLELFEAAQIELPGAVRRDLAELRRFHDTLIANRRQFLAGEIDAINARIVLRSVGAQDAEVARAERLAILASHGALEEYTRMQGRLSARREELARVVDALAALDRIETGARAIKLDAQAAYDAARVVQHERQAQRERAISLFNSYSEFLYNEPGNLLLEVRQTRDMPTFEFGVEIQRSKATGIEHMKTLCLDLTIAALWAEHAKRPGFVLHDSALFEGVDERQRALALALVEREARQRGYQYILALNTDQLTNATPPGFDPRRYERLHLTDQPPEGSLFGVRF